MGNASRIGVELKLATGFPKQEQTGVFHCDPVFESQPAGQMRAGHGEVAGLAMDEEQIARRQAVGSLVERRGVHGVAR